MGGWRFPDPACSRVQRRSIVQRWIVRGVLWLLVLVACSEPAGHPCSDTNICVPDAFDHVCGVVPQSGCQVGEKCTSGHLGAIGCAPDGTAGRGELCSVDTEGNDTCSAGLYCTTSKVCALVCDATAPACPDGTYCSLATSLFIHDGRIIAGVCLPL